VIFGASGDLAKLKLIPALYELARQNLLDDKAYIMGYSRSVMTDEQFRAHARESIDKFARTKPIDEAVWKKLEPRLFYFAGDYDSTDSHGKCADRMLQLDKQLGTPDNRVFYISTPPTRVRADHHLHGRAAGRKIECGLEAHHHRKTIWPRPGVGPVAERSAA